YQRGAAGDTELGVARGAGTLRGRDDREDAAADLLADQRGLQAGQHRPADYRRAAGEGVRFERGALALPEVEDEVGGQGLALGQGGAAALDEGPDRQAVTRRGLRDGHLRRLVERAACGNGGVRAWGGGGRGGWGRRRGSRRLRLPAAGREDQAGQQGDSDER